MFLYIYIYIYLFLFFNFSYKSQKVTNKHVFAIIFPLEGDFDIDARDGDGGGGPFRTPPNSPKSQQIARTKIVHTSGTFFKKCSKISLKYLHIYRKIHRIR